MGSRKSHHGCIKVSYSVCYPNSLSINNEVDRKVDLPGCFGHTAYLKTVENQEESRDVVKST